MIRLSAVFDQQTNQICSIFLLNQGETSSEGKEALRAVLLVNFVRDIRHRKERESASDDVHFPFDSDRRRSVEQIEINEIFSSRVRLTSMKNRTMSTSPSKHAMINGET